MKNLLLLIVCLTFGTLQAQDSLKVYQFQIHEEIDAPAWRITDLAIDAAIQNKSDYILLHLNTYGGRVDFADSIRSKILNCPIPVLVYIENNAASAGALISIACDSIYMSPGSTIGAATVVDETGTPAPEKYQSYFRSKMRATAIESGRNPDIAEAMVDPKIVVEGVVDDKTLVTFTVDEAIKNKFCEGRANSPKEAVQIALGDKKVQINQHKVSAIEKIIGFLINPAVSGILIMMIIGGVYLEVQQPGMGFPSIIALIGAILFFAPHYLHGLAANWEIILFFVGLLLIALEVFVIPGFGVAGIAGIICVVVGLAFSLVGVVPSDTSLPLPAMSDVTFALAIVLGALTIGLFSSVYLGGKLLSNHSGWGGKVALVNGLTDDHIQPSSSQSFSDLNGKTGTAKTDLHPGGKVLIDGKTYDAICEVGFIEKGTEVVVLRSSHAQLVVARGEY